MYGCEKGSVCQTVPYALCFPATGLLLGAFHFPRRKDRF